MSYLKVLLIKMATKEQRRRLKFRNMLCFTIFFLLTSILEFEEYPTRQIQLYNVEEHENSFL